MKHLKLPLLTFILVFSCTFYNCSSDDTPVNDQEQGSDTNGGSDEDNNNDSDGSNDGDGNNGDENNGDGNDGDSNTDGTDSSSDIPYVALNLTSWKITLPRDLSGDGKADEVYLDATRNDYAQDPSFTEYKDEFFFVENGNVRFLCPTEQGTPTTSNSSNTRSELREMPSNGDGETGWDATDSKIKTLTFKVRIIQTSSTKKFAFAQIHDFQQDVWDDLLRVQIQSDKAFAKEGDTGRIYLLGDVIEGELSDGFPIDFRSQNYADRYIKNDYVLGDWLTFKITVQNSTLKIYLDDMSTPIRSYDNITCTSNYYKAGLYNQSVNDTSTGNGIVEFSEITVSENF
ncbi:polysaccharide lyase family 7 protein [Aquimarina sp. D1M17]|uniref:polysaccharide lyase family 7 protein n=1 Tax=Aquimarina acroporae TaxID=2937283 RepID=UPI0020BE21FA|nr:polysaccharide lyase family 7 protein [Aquimarina acroporae]MCK8523412.1 polysaccharide lyase family 7 protein [Aquimarina acroporae]